MLRQAYDRTLYSATWQIFVPGGAIAITIFAFNILGDGLRDVLGVGRSKKARRSERRGLTTVQREVVAGTAAPGATDEASAGSSASDALLRIDGLSVEFVARPRGEPRGRGRVDRDPTGGDGRARG